MEPQGCVLQYVCQIQISETKACRNARQIVQSKHRIAGKPVKQTILDHCLGAANVLFKLFGISTIRQDDMTPEDIYAVMDAGAEAGVLKKQEHHLIENIFDMQERTVTSVMNPRENIVYFDTQTSTEAVVEVMIEQPHNKFLVCHDDDLEHIIGYVESRSFLALVLNQQEVSLTDKALLKPALFVPDTLSLFEVLEMFKSTGADFAVIVNEYGLVVGVITLKDVMSIVMGELVTMEEQAIVQRTDNSWLSMV